MSDNIYTCLPSHHYSYHNYYNLSEKNVYSILVAKKKNDKKKEYIPISNQFNKDNKLLFPLSDGQSLFKYIEQLYQNPGRTSEYNRFIYYESSILITCLIRQLVLVLIHNRDDTQSLQLIGPQIKKCVGYIAHQLTLKYDNQFTHDKLHDPLLNAVECMFSILDYMITAKGKIDPDNSRSIDYNQKLPIIVDKIVDCFKNDLINNDIFLNRLKKALLVYFNTIYDEMIFEVRGDQLNSSLQHEKAIKNMIHVTQIFI